MKEKLKKIWTDPVFSKVIGQGIIVILGLLIIFFYQEFIYLLMMDIKLWLVLSVILGLLISYLSIFLFRFRYSEKTRDLDTKLFERIRNELLTQDDIMEVRNNGFSSNPFETTRIRFIRAFIEENQKSDFTFFNPKLEQKKGDMSEALRKLNIKLATYIFGTGNPGWVSIPREWEINDPDRLDEAIEEITICENAVTESYDNFIRVGRKILKV